MADVSRSLPLSLRQLGVDVRLLMPAYPQAYLRTEDSKFLAKIPPALGVSDATLIGGIFPGADLPVYLIDSPSLFRRNGGLYQDGNGQDWPDNPLRFAFFAHVAREMGMGRLKIDFRPDVVHANDWHAGLVPLFLSLEQSPRPATVFTSHNMAFQGNFPAEWLGRLGIPAALFSVGGVEFYGKVSFLKAGLRFADRVTTVSPTYAREILTPAFGSGMEGVLSERGENFSGILNGIDEALWNPATDPALARPYRETDISGKRVCKAALQQEFGLAVRPETPIFGFVSRLTHQKMADIVLDMLPWLYEQDAQFVAVGEGDPKIEAAFLAAAEQYGKKIAVVVGYDEALAHKLHAGCDILLAPARFEPCGLTQLYALRYGSLPLVRRTGGLADTVVDAAATAIADRSATGFVFDEPTVEALIATAERALGLYREPLIWRRLQLQAMAQNYSWTSSAMQYAALYSAASGRPFDLGAAETKSARPTQQTTIQAAG